MNYICEVPAIALDKRTGKRPITGVPLPHYEEYDEDLTLWGDLSI
tara:strand:+ start:95 stop:229 length:135 start_codon:yes stop_codon:yes gene_type:complete